MKTNRNAYLYATDRQMAFLKRLLNECFSKGVGDGCYYDLSRDMTKSAASAAIERLLAALAADKRCEVAS